MPTRVAAFAAGFIFAVGLVCSGMTHPLKVLAFLDFAGDWDPSLAFVMGGAIAVYAPLSRWIARRPTPLLEPTFDWPEPRRIDTELVVGAGLFGIGWGLAGVCPGPAIVNLVTLGSSALVFVGSMLLGMVSLEVWRRVSTTLPERRMKQADEA